MPDNLRLAQTEHAAGKLHAGRWKSPKIGAPRLFIALKMTGRDRASESRWEEVDRVASRLRPLDERRRGAGSKQVGEI